MNILITGCSGSLGRFIMKHLNRENYKTIICIINSEKRYKENEFLFNDCIIYKGDISNKEFIREIFNDYNINYVIHAAAMKYIDTCEKFQRNCIDSNIIGTLNICEISKKKNVTNLITISSDKANNPSSLYGISKLASENITLSHGFNVYQGVNFWNSDGSFLQKWKTAIRNKKQVILYDDRHIRYFSELNETAKEILYLIEERNLNRIIYPTKCMKIKIIDVFNYLKNLYSDVSFVIKKSEENEFDKIEEEINNFTEVENLEYDQINRMIDKIL